MRSILGFLVFCSSLWASGSDIDSFITGTEVFLQKYVNHGQVNYSLLKKNKKEIVGLINEISVIDLATVDQNAKKAFYINAYNLLVIQAIVEAYPVKSPMDIPGFFDKKRHKVAGEMLTLNQLEKEKLLMPLQDARLHFALVCAAKSCPSLVNKAFRPDQLEKQLDERTRVTVNDPNWLMVKPDQKQVSISKIFEWYSGDFTVKGNSVIDWINKYRNSKIPTNYKVEYYEYDWALNGK